MSNRRYTEEFKIEAVIKQITERSYSIQEVSKRWGVMTHSLHSWRKIYGQGPQHVAEIDDQQAEINRLKAELRRVTEDILISEVRQIEQTTVCDIVTD